MGDAKSRRTRPEAQRRAIGLAAHAFDHLQAGLLRFLLRRLRSRQHAEDLAQEVYLRLLRFADAELVKRPDAYVYQVAFNVLCEFRLNEQRSPVTFDSEAAARLSAELEDAAAPLDEMLDQSAHERQLSARLERLPPMQRAVFLLAIRHGLPHAEIAQRLGISMHTVRKHLYRAIHACRRWAGEEPRKESP